MIWIGSTKQKCFKIQDTFYHENSTSETRSDFEPLSNLFFTLSLVHHFLPKTEPQICWSWSTLRLNPTLACLPARSGSSLRIGDKRSPWRWPMIFHPRSLPRRSRGRWVKPIFCRRNRLLRGTTACSSWLRLWLSLGRDWCRP